MKNQMRIAANIRRLQKARTRQRSQSVAEMRLIRIIWGRAEEKGDGEANASGDEQQ
jgi:hypothetical protein